MHAEKAIAAERRGLMSLKFVKFIKFIKFIKFMKLLGIG
jgi:hypothetical protein